MDSLTFEQQYKETLQWLYSQLPMFSRVGAPAYKPGLQTTETLDSLFGHPHRKFKSIHVAGTNGKGSTSHMIASTLQAAGYKTALYTSPHLTDFRERMKINGNMISREAVIDFVRRWKGIAKENPSRSPSFFELTMMMAFDWFAREGVDHAVIEVGMGGRLDSTNIITPLLSVVTNISFDHTQFLGDTLEAIAGEKAGIIKKGVPVVIGETVPDTKEVFLAKALLEDTPILFAEDYADEYEFKPTAEGWQVIHIEGNTYEIPLGGEYQKKNIVTALKSLEKLREGGIEISRKAIHDGLRDVVKNTGLRGRWQVVREHPTVVCDTGHNSAGIATAMQTLSERYPGRKKRMVIGFVNDKDVAHIVDLFPKDCDYYFAQACVPRAMPVDKLASIFAAKGITGKNFPTVKEAAEAAIADSEPEDVVYIGGSTFVVADFLASLE